MPLSAIFFVLSKFFLHHSEVLKGVNPNARSNAIPLTTDTLTTQAHRENSPQRGKPNMPESKVDSRGRPLLTIQTTNHLIQRKRVPPNERMPGASDYRFQQALPQALPSSSLLQRSNARAGNGNGNGNGNGRKKEDQVATSTSDEENTFIEDPYAPRLRKKSSTFSFMSGQDLNRSERSLVNGHDPRSFANRVLRDSRPMSMISEDVTATLMPNAMQPGQIRVRDAVGRSELRDSQIRLSRYHGDLLHCEGMSDELMFPAGEHPAFRHGDRGQPRFTEDLAEARKPRK